MSPGEHEPASDADSDVLVDVEGETDEGIARLSVARARVLGEALFRIAQADGAMDPREVEVVEGFLKDCGAGVPEALEDPGPAPSLAVAASGLVDAFLCACILLAFADGDFTAEEAVCIRGYAETLGVTRAHLEDLVALVQSEQSLPVAPPPVVTLLDVLAGWAGGERPELKHKIERLLERAPTAT